MGGDFWRDGHVDGDVSYGSIVQDENALREVSECAGDAQDVEHIR